MNFNHIIVQTTHIFWTWWTTKIECGKRATLFSFSIQSYNTDSPGFCNQRSIWQRSSDVPQNLPDPKPSDGNIQSLLLGNPFLISLASCNYLCIVRLSCIVLWHTFGISCKESIKTEAVFTLSQAKLGKTVLRFWESWKAIFSPSVYQKFSEPWIFYLSWGLVLKGNLQSVNIQIIYFLWLPIINAV